MAGSRRAQHAILTNENLFHSVSSTNLRNQLNKLWIVEASITANDEEAAFGALRNGEDNAGNERLAIMGLLKDGGLLAKA